MTTKTETKPSICSICRQPYSGWGNNAHPFPGRCCDACNDVYVIPARFESLGFKAKGTKQ